LHSSKWGDSKDVAADTGSIARPRRTVISARAEQVISNSWQPGRRVLSFEREHSVR